MRRTTLPLGIDIGATLTRVALLERTDSAAPRLLGCAVRATGDDAVSAITGARAELATRERRCILALSAPEAVLRSATFPRMRPAERARAARFDAARSLSYPIDDAEVRVVTAGDDRCIIGIARRTALVQRVAAAKAAGLRPVAVDDAGLALLRAFPHAGAVVDVGTVTTNVIVAGDVLPFIKTVPLGGRAVTSAVAQSLGIDDASAELRKRTIGLAGAGESARDALIEHVASAFIETRSSGSSDVRSIALTGNGARLEGLAGALERAVAIPVRLATLPPDVAPGLPADVVRAASPDWGLAFGLALWETCA